MSRQGRPVSGGSQNKFVEVYMKKLFLRQDGMSRAYTLVLSQNRHFNIYNFFYIPASE